MGNMKLVAFLAVCTQVWLATSFVLASARDPANGSLNFPDWNERSSANNLHPKIVFRKRANPTPGSAPLDLNELIKNELASLNQILGIVGGGVSGLVAGLTGISITNCAGQIKAKGDVNAMTCEEFLDALSGCESLMNVKDLIQAAKQRYKKNPNSKKPCFK